MKKTDIVPPEGRSGWEAKDQALFDRIAEKYARKDLLPAHGIARKHRLQQTLAHIPVDKGVSMLEVGCGAGFSSRYLAGNYTEYHGIDYSEKLVSYARHQHVLPHVRFTAINVNELPAEWKFDVIFMIGVVHHLEQPDRVLSGLRANLNSGGWLVVNEPQRSNPIIHLMRVIRKKLDSGYSEDQREYNEAELQDLFKQSGYLDIATYPQGFFSTPFAEVAMPMQRLATSLAQTACKLDGKLESGNSAILKKLAWNLVVAGRKNS